ncbi:MAG: DUF2203 domain-containing protein [Polyangiaceae bacterium]|nr:DUF2203 domain-containing protein [Polyangiaceae bacterium]MCW5790199.1 DUF2203 domain-containing protein [Polyangiaceae bacterium]
MTTRALWRPDRRAFTVHEVDQLIPVLTTKVSELLIARSEIERAMAELSEHLGHEPRTLEAEPGDSAMALRIKRELKGAMKSYEQGWNEIERLGAVVKDPRIGLLDFYGHLNGRWVWLCWRYGEDSLGYYHDLDAGYSSRKPLGRQERALLLN